MPEKNNLMTGSSRVQEMVPKYQQLRSALLEKLGEKRFAKGQKFYSETHIARTFGLNPFTVRKALSLLKNDGYLRSERGLGTFVKSLPHAPRRLKVVEDCSLGILLGELERENNVALAMVLAGIEESAVQGGYLLHLGRMTVPGHLPRIVADKHVDGVISMGWIDAENAEQLKNSGMPVVVLGHGRESYPYFHSVTSDAAGAGRMAARHLLRLGHEKVGIIMGKSIWPGLISELVAGFTEACSEAGLPVREEFIKVDEHQDDYVLAQTLVESKDLPTGILLGNWVGVSQSMHAMSEKGLKVPEDISVVGYGDNVWAMYANPAVTAVRVFSRETGREAVKLLMDVIKDPQGKPRNICLATELVERGSCRRLA